MLWCCFCEPAHHPTNRSSFSFWLCYFYVVQRLINATNTLIHFTCKPSVVKFTNRNDLFDIKLLLKWHVPIRNYSIHCMNVHPCHVNKTSVITTWTHIHCKLQRCTGKNYCSLDKFSIHNSGTSIHIKRDVNKAVNKLSYCILKHAAFLNETTLTTNNISSHVLYDENYSNFITIFIKPSFSNKIFIFILVLISQSRHYVLVLHNTLYKYKPQDFDTMHILCSISNNS